LVDVSVNANLQNKILSKYVRSNLGDTIYVWTHRIFNLLVTCAFGVTVSVQWIPGRNLVAYIVRGTQVSDTPVSTHKTSRIPRIYRCTSSVNQNEINVSETIMSVLFRRMASQGVL
jgi:hypothetical protein